MLSDEVLRQQGQLFAALDGLGATGSPKLLEGARTVRLDGVLGNEELRGDLAIAEAAGNEGEDFRLAIGDAEILLVGRIAGEGSNGAGFCWDQHLPHHHALGGFAPARNAQPEPDAEGREQDGHERTVDFDGVLDDDEAIFGVLEDGDEQTANQTEDENVALHELQDLGVPDRRIRGERPMR